METRRTGEIFRSDAAFAAQPWWRRVLESLLFARRSITGWN